MIKNKKYKVDNGIDIFVAEFISEGNNYYIFRDLLSNEDISVKKEFSKIEEYVENSNLYSMQSDKIEAIISRKEMREMYRLFDKKCVLISIYDPCEKPLNLNYFNKELYISFFDITSSIGGCSIISDSESKLIKDFIIQNKDKKFIINCEAGKSRSAGVGLAIECLLEFNGNKYEYSISNSKIKEHPRYYPNLTVFDKIINA